MTDLFRVARPTMSAITLWQPWASLIAVGAKKYETRHWKPPARLLGERVAIHAAARRVEIDLPREYLVAFTDALGLGWSKLPRSAVVCTAVLYLVDRAENVPADLYGDYSPGRFVWGLRDVEVFDPPIPAKGAQGWWNWRRDPALSFDCRKGNVDE